MKKCIYSFFFIALVLGFSKYSMADDPFDLKINAINKLSDYSENGLNTTGSLWDDRHNTKMYWTSSRPDGHAPIGVMGDHTHTKGEFMFSYRYMYMNMDGNLDGTTELTTSEITSATGNYKYMITPENMTMQMHMLGVMYAATDRLTLMAMFPYVMKSMDHITRSGVTFTTETSGIGDISLTGLYRLMNKDRNAIHANLGLSFPTGSIDAMDVTPASSPNETILPYPMQLGSGSVGIAPGITYLGQTDCLSWGAQASGTFYVGDNNRDYKLGNKYNVTAWGAYVLAKWLSASLRVNSVIVQNITGADTTLNPAMIPTADPNLRGGKRIDINLGFNVYSFEGSLKGLRFAVEGGLPIYQNLDGPQLKTSWSIVTGLQYAFH